jgi:Uma2 family endonuclease
MSSVPLAISVEEYLNTAYEPDCDYVDGTLIDRHVGEKQHSKTQRELLFYLHRKHRELGIFVIQEQRLRISHRRYRVPDVLVVAGPEPDEEVFTEPPFLCIEVLSPQDRMSRMQEKIADYLSFGVPFVWVVDPRTRKAWVYTPGGMHEVSDGLLRTDNPSIVVPLADIFV